MQSGCEGGHGDEDVTLLRVPDREIDNRVGLVADLDGDRVRLETGVDFGDENLLVSLVAEELSAVDGFHYHTGSAVLDTSSLFPPRRLTTHADCQRGR